MVAGLNQPGSDQTYNFLSGTALLESIDYEQKKLLATKGTYLCFVKYMQTNKLLV